MSIIEYLEDLPESCPPADAINREMVVYRVVTTIPPCEDDFYSQRKKFPFRPFSLDECIVRACSVFDNEYDIRKKPKLLSKDNVKLIRFKITKMDGKVKKTLSPGHHSWWIYRCFDFSDKEYEELDE